MKNPHWICYPLAIVLCLIGILCRDRLHILDKAFVILGIALFLLAFTLHCISKAPRCPNCNALIYSGHIRNIVRQKNGMVPCPQCGSMVCVNHAKRN